MRMPIMTNWGVQLRLSKGRSATGKGCRDVSSHGPGLARAAAAGEAAMRALTAALSAAAADRGALRLVTSVTSGHAAPGAPPATRPPHSEPAAELNAPFSAADDGSARTPAGARRPLKLKGEAAAAAG